MQISYMEKKRKNCHAMLTAKFNKKQPKQSQLYELPVEHARKIIKDRSDMKDKKFQGEQTAYLQALKYMPHALMKLWETMPMPWENTKQVRAIYHVNGALTMVNEINKVSPPVYMAQWGCMWVAMRREKRDRKHFKRMRFPCFDDEEPIVNFSENIMDIDPLDPIQLELDDEEDADVIDWIYEDTVPQVSGSHYHFDTKTLATLYRLASPLTTDIYDPNYYYLFNDKAIFTSKALNVAVAGGPKFEPLYPDLLKEEINEDWNEFNDLKRVLIRLPIRPEYKIALPHLFNQIPKSVVIDVYHHPINLYNNDSLDSAFVFDPSFNPINTRDLQDPFEPIEQINPTSTPFDLLPFYSDYGLETEHTINGISLYHAPWPFQPTGYTIRRQDVPVIKNWYLQRCPPNQPVKVRVSYQKLLKNHIKNALVRKSMKNNKKQYLAKILRNTKYFQQTKIDWVEAGLQLLQQGHNMLNLLITKKELSYLHLDYNFNLKPVKSMSTKERKRSRFGNAFHLIREMMRLTKMVVDAHVQFRLGNIDAYQLADGLQYTFSHVGHLTGIYRYKYKIMKQIRLCKDLKHLIYSRFNSGPVGKGPGCGFWLPMWRVWINFTRGITPLLERWLSNILSRVFEGRQNTKGALQVSKQRIEAQYDLELRASILHDLVDMMPVGIRERKVKIILQHLSEAWRCWKANLVWDVPGMPPPIANVIHKYIKLKSDWWIKTTEQVRNRIAKGNTCDKTVVKKNLGRLTRLYLKEEQQRQSDYLINGPLISPTESTTLYTTMVDYLDAIKYNPINFPPLNYKHDAKLLVLALEKLREAYSVKSRLNQQQREEMGLIEQAYDNPNEALTRIKRLLLTQRTFKSVNIEFLDLFDSLSPMYDIDPLEKITDAWLDQYLWYEADKRQLFPNFIKPSDNEPLPVLVHDFIQHCGTLNKSNTNIILHTKLTNFYNHCDLSLLNTLLRLIMDPNLADYITSKYNIELSYKDMTHSNHFGMIRGLQFSSFVVQYYGLMVDLLILGVPRTLAFKSNTLINHPITHYIRIIDVIYIIFSLNKSQINTLLTNSSNYPINHPNYNHYNNIQSFPKDQRMRLLQKDMIIGKSIYFTISSRIPTSIATLEWSDTFPCVYSHNNPNLLFSMAGFDVKMSFTNITENDSNQWPIIYNGTVVGMATVLPSNNAINEFQNRMRQILMSSGGTTFLKVVQKWNTALLGLVVYYREAILNSNTLLDLLIKFENKVQNRIKMGLNSKMPARFPPVVFYTPKELGGLGMLSIGHVLVPESDLRWSNTTKTTNTHFRNGLSATTIPNIFRYITPWLNEILDSKVVWQEYAELRQQAQQEQRRLTLDELSHLFDRGLPRINTLFQKDRHTLSYDRGFRVRLHFKQFSILRVNTFQWTDTKHDGKLWTIINYRTDMIEALGGTTTILQHTLFAATGFPHYEGLFWEKSTGFEASMQHKKLTNAQRSGLNQIPNRRFTLWWSPTINRSQVYIGFLVQLDLTGIMMTGKIPNLKISFIQIFRGHLWQKIHESVVMDICNVLDLEMGVLDISSVVKEQIHPRKSYKMNSSCADIVITGHFKISLPINVTEALANANTNATITKMWVDVQLKWGDYDLHDIDRYARMKYLDYSSDNTSIYPSQYGIIVAIDLAYLTVGMYGNWIPGLAQLMKTAMNKIILHNPALFVLRERVKKQLQLYQSSTTEEHLSSSNYSDLFNQKTWFIDDTNVYRVNIHKSGNGSLTTNAINGALFILNPSTGQLYLKIIHSSTWHGESRIGQLSKWKVAEEVAMLIKGIPLEERPTSIVVTRKGMLDALEVHLLDFPNIVIKGSLLQLPFHAILKIERLGDMVMKATSSQMVLFNVYDDWLKGFSAYTAFSRFVLVLRAMHISTVKTRVILDGTNTTNTNTMFPVHDEEEWITIEVQLKDLILEDYGIKNAINIKSLTMAEIRDIVLGADVSKPSMERQLLIEQQQPVEAQAIKTFNKQGEEMILVTTSQYEQQHFNSKTDWRHKMMGNREMSKRGNKIVNMTDGDDVKISKGLLNKFIMISDLKTRIVGLMCGRNGVVEYIVMVPQYGNSVMVEMTVTGLTLGDYIGILSTKVVEDMQGDLKIKEQVGEITGIKEQKMVCVVYVQGSVKLEGDMGVGLEDDNNGYFKVPLDGIWHYNFIGAMHRKDYKYGLKIDVPCGFYEDVHRPMHYSVFDEMEENDVDYEALL